MNNKQCAANEKKGLVQADLSSNFDLYGHSLYSLLWMSSWLCSCVHIHTHTWGILVHRSFWLLSTYSSNIRPGSNSSLLLLLIYTFHWLREWPSEVTEYSLSWRLQFTLHESLVSDVLHLMKEINSCIPCFDDCNSRRFWPIFSQRQYRNEDFSLILCKKLQYFTLFFIRWQNCELQCLRREKYNVYDVC